jgi:hypothetical protein
MLWYSGLGLIRFQPFEFEFKSQFAILFVWNFYSQGLLWFYKKTSLLRLSSLSFNYWQIIAFFTCLDLAYVGSSRKRFYSQ